ncbi:hypothetical protein MYCTH_2303933 [Thermothelomyces thermophilus ATCC 42464]|uniref:Dihydrofolate reductase n=1 Tax=Thermothelomyces thermophilus (strain ATCC 42464 / BCRC 31852 / DSM 1799) TaxID=573729 RepID=G2QE14_THET4|nr:uncharacterized protein MYCTH_2303933 [Thermothelomyces thermophilus ATCC 42464]AEO57597.1 hypothetical protein MYCTH_2303933 [Thermothelomyces thermophilus ATCC 42464]
MPAANPLLPELTLIVAATQQMGIGRNGTLPWTGLRKEMAYFARVTKRLPPAPSQHPHQQQQHPHQQQQHPHQQQQHPHQQQQQSTGDGQQQQQQLVQNAVIMGRKTWESIPERFRPLPGRWNVVISRKAAAAAARGGGSLGAPGGEENPVMAAGLEEALRYLGGRPGVGRVFVIGGAQIYRAALETAQARRVLLTRVRTEFECDTFFPLRLDEANADADAAAAAADADADADADAVIATAAAAAAKGWRRSGQEEMDAWVGEEVPRGVQAEAGTEYEFEMWERVD